MSFMLILIFSPTRFLIEWLKPNVSDYDKTIRQWNWLFRSIMVASVALLYFAKTRAALGHLPGYFPLWIPAISRINELARAFWKDAFQQLKSGQPETTINLEKRLRYLASSYFEVAIQFGILYFCLPNGLFSARDFSSIVEAIYFSVATITTLGYDMIPKHPLSQLVCMYELGIGFVLIVFSLGSYLSASSRGED